MNPRPDQPFYNTSQVAALLGKAEITIRVAARRSKGRIGTKLPNGWVFTQDDVATLRAKRIGRPKAKEDA